MMLLPYLCVILLLTNSTFMMDLDLLLVFLSLPVSIKLIVDMHNKEKEQLNQVLFSTSNFLRLFFILILIGIVL